MPDSILLEAEAELSDLESLASKIMGLIGEQPFCLWLKGEMGAGKTTLTGHLLRALGLNPMVPVQSPTYTLLNDYDIGDKRYAHLDFYRVLDNFSLDELGIHDVYDIHGYFVEWPEVPRTDETLKPTHLLNISTISDDIRRFELSRFRLN